MSLLEEQLEEIRKKTAAAGVTPSMVEQAGAPPSPAGLLPLEAPKYWTEQAMERDGKAKFFGKMLLGGFTGLGPLLFPESIGAKARYASELTAYQDALAERQGRSRHQAGLDLLMNGVDDPEDAFQRLTLAKEFGIDELQYALGGGVVTPDADWEKVDIDGQYFYVDKNNPTDTPVPVTMEDGSFAYSDLSEGQAKNVNYFERAVPRIEQMHRLEDEGVALPRAVLQAVARAENPDGFIDGALFDMALNNMGLDEKQREYLDAAKDFSMINLRKDSGAAISASEMIKELQNTIVLDDFSDDHYTSNRSARRRRATALLAGMPKRVRDKYKDKLEGLSALEVDRVIKEIEEDAGSFGILKEDANGYTPPTLEELMSR